MHDADMRLNTLLLDRKEFNEILVGIGILSFPDCSRILSIASTIRLPSSLMVGLASILEVFRATITECCCDGSPQINVVQTDVNTKGPGDKTSGLDCH